MTVGLAHRTGKVLSVNSTPAVWRVVDWDKRVDDPCLDQLRATRLQLFRCPDARLPPIPAPKRRGINHQEPPRERKPASLNEMRNGPEHELGVGAGDQDGQVTARGTSTVLRF